MHKREFQHILNTETSLNCTRIHGCFRISETNFIERLRSMTKCKRWRCLSAFNSSVVNGILSVKCDVTFTETDEVYAILKL